MGTDELAAVLFIVTGFCTLTGVVFWVGAFGYIFIKAIKFVCNGGKGEVR